MKERFIDKLKRVIHSGRNAKLLEYALKQHLYIQNALNSKESGVSKEKLCGEEVIVSLTSYGRRIHDVAPTIESIMQGSMKPNRIVLWLGYELKDETLPIALKKQQERGLEVIFCKDIRSYTKLVPALRKFPEASIITIDDDIMYPYDLVERLVNEHIKYPKDIISNRVHRVKLGKDGKPIVYAKWDIGATIIDDSPLNFETGVGGVLYPAHCFDSEVTNEEVFLDICKYADDVWFYCMALKNGTRVRKCPTHRADGEDFLSNDVVQDTGLVHINTSKRGRSANDDQLEAVMNRYGLWGVLKEVK